MFKFFSNLWSGFISIFSKVPSASVIQADVTVAVGVARDAALFNPGVEAAVNGFVGTIHTYLVTLSQANGVLPAPTLVSTFLDAEIAKLAANLPVNLQAQFTTSVDDLEDAVVVKYAAFYGVVSNTKPYLDALIQATA